MRPFAKHDHTTLELDKIQIRCIEELREHFEVEQLVKWYFSGDLFRFLASRGFTAEMNALQRIPKLGMLTNYELISRLCRIIGIHLYPLEVQNLLTSEQLEVDAAIINSRQALRQSQLPRASPSQSTQSHAPVSSTAGLVTTAIRESAVANESDSASAYATSLVDFAAIDSESPKAVSNTAAKDASDSSAASNPSQPRRPRGPRVALFIDNYDQSKCADKDSNSAAVLSTNESTFYLRNNQLHPELSIQDAPGERSLQAVYVPQICISSEAKNTIDRHYINLNCPHVQELMKAQGLTASAIISTTVLANNNSFADTPTDSQDCTTSASMAASTDTRDGAKAACVEAPSISAATDISVSAKTAYDFKNSVTCKVKRNSAYEADGYPNESSTPFRRKLFSLSPQERIYHHLSQLFHSSASASTDTDPSSTSTKKAVSQPMCSAAADSTVSSASAKSTASQAASDSTPNLDSPYAALTQDYVYKRSEVSKLIASGANASTNQENNGFGVSSFTPLPAEDKSNNPVCVQSTTTSSQLSASRADSNAVCSTSTQAAAATAVEAHIETANSSSADEALQTDASGADTVGLKPHARSESTSNTADEDCLKEVSGTCFGSGSDSDSDCGSYAGPDSAEYLEDASGQDSDLAEEQDEVLAAFEALLQCEEGSEIDLDLHALDEVFDIDVEEYEGDLYSDAFGFLEDASESELDELTTARIGKIESRCCKPDDISYEEFRRFQERTHGITTRPFENLRDNYENHLKHIAHQGIVLDTVRMVYVNNHSTQENTFEKGHTLPELKHIEVHPKPTGEEPPLPKSPALRYGLNKLYSILGAPDPTLPRPRTFALDGLNSFTDVCNAVSRTSPVSAASASQTPSIGNPSSPANHALVRKCKGSNHSLTYNNYRGYSRQAPTTTATATVTAAAAASTTPPAEVAELSINDSSPSLSAMQPSQASEVVQLSLASHIASDAEQRTCAHDDASAPAAMKALAKAQSYRMRIEKANASHSQNAAKRRLATAPKVFSLTDFCKAIESPNTQSTSSKPDTAPKAAIDSACQAETSLKASHVSATESSPIARSAHSQPAISSDNANSLSCVSASETQDSTAIRASTASAPLSSSAMPDASAASTTSEKAMHPYGVVVRSDRDSHAEAAFLDAVAQEVVYEVWRLIGHHGLGADAFDRIAAMAMHLAKPHRRPIAASKRQHDIELSTEDADRAQESKAGSPDSSTAACELYENAPLLAMLDELECSDET